MIEYARLRPGPGFRPTQAALYYSQRLVTQPHCRRLVSRSIAAVINLLHPDRPPAPAGAMAEAYPRLLGSLTRDGCAVLENRLPASALSDIEMFLRDKEAVGREGNRFRADRAPPGTRMAAYPLSTVLDCPYVLEVINHPDVLGIATGYLGCVPTISSIGIRWSFPGAGDTADTQQFHRDLDDWRALKLFIYLTDVDAESGPHIFVAGSHRTAGRLFASPYARDEVERRYGRESFRTITGPRGTSFIADTYGIHKGGAPESKPRFILQVQYSLLPIFAFRYEPLAVGARPDLDRYVNRLLVA